MLIFTYFGNSEGNNKGIPTPKFTFMPGLTYLTNLRTILYLALSAYVS